MNKYNFGKILFFVLPILLLLGGRGVMAQSLPSDGGKLYGLQITVNNGGDNTQTQSFTFDDGVETLEFFEGDSLSGTFAAIGAFTGYDSISSAVDARVNYQGVLVTLQYALGDDVLRFAAVDANLEVYCGPAGCASTRTAASTSSGKGTRDDSEQALEDYLKDGDFANQLNAYLAVASPTSPIAGNPSSLQSTLADSAFSAGIDTSTGINIGGGDGGTTTTNHAIPVGVRFGRYSQRGKDVDNYTVPLRYGYEWSDGRKINIALPLSYITIGDAKTYKAGLEVAYTHPINKQWKLTPGIGYGLIASKELLTGTQVGSVSLTSLYTFDKSIIGGEDWSLSIANMGVITKLSRLLSVI